jgi:hypothetical protein
VSHVPHDVAANEPGGVIWREETWRCELVLVLGYPTLRLYDGKTLELEHEIMPGTITATAEVMRRAVRRYLSGEYKLREAVTPVRDDLKETGPGGGAVPMCPHCRSLRAHLWGTHPGKAWYVCADCARLWDLPAKYDD